MSQARLPLQVGLGQEDGGMLKRGAQGTAVVRTARQDTGETVDIVASS